MEYYKLRIDVLPLKEEVYLKLQSYFTTYVRALEVGSEATNPHYHYYISMTSSAVSVRQYIRANIGKGNGVYSLKKLDEEFPPEYLAYLVKEDKETIWYKMPEGLKEKAIAYDLKVKEDLSKKGKKPAWKKAEEYVKERFGNVPFNESQIVEAVIDYYLENDMMIRKFLIIDIVQTILVSNNPKYKQNFIQNITQNIMA